MRAKQNDDGFAMLKTATRPVQVKRRKLWLEERLFDTRRTDGWCWGVTCFKVVEHVARAHYL